MLKTYGFFTDGQAASGTQTHSVAIEVWLLTRFLSRRGQNYLCTARGMRWPRVPPMSRHGSVSKRQVINGFLCTRAG